MRRVAWLFAVPALLAGCGGDDPVEFGGSGGSGGAGGASGDSVAVYPVDWNGEGYDVGVVASVAESGNALLVFSDHGALAMEAGQVVSVDDTITTWQSAGVIPAADGSGDWIVGVDAGGAVLRAQPRVNLDNVTARYDLSDVRVLVAAAAGPGLAAFGFEGGLAVADATTVVRYEVEAFTSVAGGGGRVALTTAAGVLVIDLMTEGATEFPLPGAALVTFDAEGRLVAATPDELFVEDAEGRLASVAWPGAGPIHGLASSGTRVWVAAGEALGLLENGAVKPALGAIIAPDTRLIGSPSGSVWTLTAGALAGYSADSSGEAGDHEAWDVNIAPVLDRSCNACHLPDGPAKSDLSTYETWVAKRGVLLQRVITERSMPPQGSELSEADREAIRVWLEGGQ